MCQDVPTTRHGFLLSFKRFGETDIEEMILEEQVFEFDNEEVLDLETYFWRKPS